MDAVVEVRECVEAEELGGRLKAPRSRLGGLGDSFSFFYTRDYAAPAARLGGVAASAQKPAGGVYLYPEMWEFDFCNLALGGAVQCTGAMLVGISRDGRTCSRARIIEWFNNYRRR